MLGGLGTTEIILIAAVLFLLFGASRLPQLAKAIGQSKKAFKEGMHEAEQEDRKELSASAPQINSMSDADLAAEMKRRAEAKQ